MLAVPPVRTLMIPVEVAIVPEVALARFWLAPPALTLSVAVLVSLALPMLSVPMEKRATVVEP